MNEWESGMGWWWGGLFRGEESKKIHGHPRTGDRGLSGLDFFPFLFCLDLTVHVVVTNRFVSGCMDYGELPPVCSSNVSVN